MTAVDALSSVQSRIAALEARFGVPGLTSSVVTAAAGGGGFAAALAAATGQLGASASSTDGASLVAGGTADGADVVAAAERYLGVPYRWGGTDPSSGLDCSGFVQRVFGDIGIDLPRVSREQARVGTPVADLSQARPGDLVAFGSPVDHIGIYAGDDTMLVAPHSGDVVKRQRITATPTAIRRVLPDASVGSLDGSFGAAEARYRLPAGLLRAVARAESGLDPSAVSPAGAQGLMQLMPSTARSLGVDPLDPASAIDGAGRLLSSHLARYGSVDLALAAYNAGPGAVDRSGGVPPYAETRTYIQRVRSYWNGAN